MYVCVCVCVFLIDWGFLIIFFLFLVFWFGFNSCFFQENSSYVFWQDFLWLSMALVDDVLV